MPILGARFLSFPDSNEDWPNVDPTSGTDVGTTLDQPTLLSGLFGWSLPGLLVVNQSTSLEIDSWRLTSPRMVFWCLKVPQLMSRPPLSVETLLTCCSDLVDTCLDFQPNKHSNHGILLHNYTMVWSSTCWHFETLHYDWSTALYLWRSLEVLSFWPMSQCYLSHSSEVTAQGIVSRRLKRAFEPKRY